MTRNQRRRKRLEIRKISPTSFHVGYWDRDTGDPGRDFRSVATATSEQEANQKKLDILKKDSRYY